MTPVSRFVHNRQLILILLSILAGSAAALGAIVFRELVTLCQVLTFGGSLEYLSGIVGDIPQWRIVLVPAAGGLLVGLFIHYVMPGGRSQGVADVMEAAALKSGKIGLRAGVGAAAASAASIGVGASVGREGPVVHLGAALSSVIATRLHLSRSQSVTLLACGVASAVAASFNAPIAGVFFAIEVVIGHYALSALAPIVIAAVIGTVISRLYFGDFPAFIVSEQAIVSFLEFPAFALLGACCAIAVFILMHSIDMASRTAARLPGPKWLRPGAAGLCVGLIALAFPEILGVGYEATDNALKNQYGLAMLIGLMAAKIAATAICLGGGFGGGIFSPSLFIGAMVGGAFGNIATDVFPNLSSGGSAYTLVGLGAVAGAVLGAPISTILIVFELTANYALTIAVMVAVVIASVIMQQSGGHSFFSWQLLRRGIDLESDREYDEVATTRVSHAMRRNHATVGPELGLGDVRERILSAPCGELYVVGGEGELLGSITLDDFRDGGLDQSIDDMVNASDIARPSVAVLAADDTLDHALNLMRVRGEEHLAVVDSHETRKLIGLVRKIDLVLIHNRALVKVRREERAGL